MNFGLPNRGMGDGWTYSIQQIKLGFKQLINLVWMNDYGQFSIMPLTEEPIFNQDKS